MTETRIMLECRSIECADNLAMVIRTNTVGYTASIEIAVDSSGKTGTHIFVTIKPQCQTDLDTDD